MPHSNKDEGRAYQRSWYHANKEKRRETKRRNRLRIREWWSAFKATKRCERCPESDPVCLTFHHVDGSKKEITLALAIGREWAPARIARELEKCVVLCANCHHKHHWEERERAKVRR